MHAAPLVALTLALLPPIAQIDDDLGGPGFDDDVVGVDGAAEGEVVELDGAAGAAAAGGILALAGGWLCLIVALGVLSLAAMIWAIIDIAGRADFDTTQKVIWVLVVLVFEVFGALAYYFIAKKPADPAPAA